MGNNENQTGESADTLETNPVVVVQGIGHLGRGFLREVGGMFWFIISTFTETMDNVRRGRRPSWIGAAPPEVAEPMYEQFVAALRRSGCPVATGAFRRMMLVDSVNDGPVTIMVESRKLF